jgi:peroxiredoxin
MKQTCLLLSALLLTAAAYAAESGIAPLEIGRSAPEFSLPGVDGKTYTLADFADADVLAVIFTCNHCPTAQAYEGRIQELAETYREKGVAVVAISPNDEQAVRLDELGFTDLSDSFAEMKFRAQEREFTFPYLYAGDQPELCQAYGPTATPHVFLFDAERKLRYKGRIDNNENPEKVTSSDTRNAIEALLAGAPVPVAETKTFGCSIKYSDKRGSVQEYEQKIAQEEVSVQEIDAEGIKRLLKNDTDKLRVINCWATFCGPCRAEFPDLIDTHHMYRNRDFELITISFDPADKGEAVLKFLQEQKASTQNFHYRGENVYDGIEAVGGTWDGGIPYTLVIKPGGEVIYSHTGQIDPLTLRRQIVEVIGRTYF